MVGTNDRIERYHREPTLHPAQDLLEACCVGLRWTQFVGTCEHLMEDHHSGRVAFARTKYRTEEPIHVAPLLPSRAAPGLALMWTSRSISPAQSDVLTAPGMPIRDIHQINQYLVVTHMAAQCFKRARIIQSDHEQLGFANHGTKVTLHQ